MLLGDIVNGKEKSHLVLVHGECFSLDFFFISRLRRHFKKIENAGLISLVQPAVYKAHCQAYVLSVFNSSAETVNQNGKPLLCCFVKSLLERYL